MGDAEVLRKTRDWRTSACRWRRTVLVTLACLLIACGKRGTTTAGSNKLTDERLLGTWQSDKERTVEELQRTRRLDEKQLAALSGMFGKLKITYTEATYTTKLDGVTESMPYEVVGRDRHSVVVRDLERREPDLGLTEFSVIHFDRPDSYWVFTEIGGFREFFRRVRE